MADGNITNLDESFIAALRGRDDTNLSDIERLELGLRGLREAFGLTKLEYRGLSVSDRSYVDRVVGEEAQARDAAVKGGYGALATARQEIGDDVTRRLAAEREHTDGVHKNVVGYVDQRIGESDAQRKAYETGTDQRLAGVDTRFTGVDERFKGVDTRFADADRARASDSASLLRAVQTGDAEVITLVRSLERNYQLQREEDNRRTDEKLAGFEQRINYLLNGVTAVLEKRERGTATAASEPAAGTASPAEGSAPV